MASFLLRALALALLLSACLAVCSGAPSTRHPAASLRGSADASKAAALPAPLCPLGNITLLLDGVAAVGEVRANAYAYFAFPSLSSSNFSLALDVLVSGQDADLYATTLSPYASTTNYQYCSQMVGSDLIQVPSAAPSLYYIAVYGWTPTTSYSLTATQQTR